MPRSRSGDRDVSVSRFKQTDGRLAGLVTSVGTLDGLVRFRDVDSSAIGSLLSFLVDEGAAVMFSRAADGGALGVTLFDGEERRRFWFHQVSDLEDWISLLQAKARSAGFGGP
jgi:hypothetical protein